MPDCGRLCQDMVFARDGIAALGDAGFVGLGCLSVGPGEARSDRKLRTLSSLDKSRTGEVGLELFGDPALRDVRVLIECTD